MNKRLSECEWTCLIENGNKFVKIHMKRNLSLEVKCIRYCKRVQ